MIASIQFLHPNVLWALFLLLIPILIHFFNLRKYTTVYFTNVSLLKDIKQETKSKSQLKQFLILLMRLLFTLFLVLAFVQPYIQKTDACQETTQVVILIDNSFSMSAEGYSGIQLEYAKRKAIEIIEAYPETVEFMLVSTDVQNQQLFFKSKDEVISLVSQIKVSPFAQNINTAISSVKNRLMLKHSEADIYLISDYQKSDLYISEDDLSSVKMLYLPSLSSVNVSIDTAYFISPIHTCFAKEELIYTLHNYSEKDLLDYTIELKINDTVKSISNVALPANYSVTDTIAFTNQNQGIQQCLLSIQDLPITFDNQLYFNYSNIDRVDAVLISDLRDNRYTEALFADNSFFKLSTFTSDNIDYNALSRSGLVIFVETESSVENASEALSQYIKSGGRLIHFASNKSHLLSILGVQQEATDSIVSQLSAVNLQSNLFKNAFKLHQNKSDLPKVTSKFCFSKDLSSLLFDEREQAFVKHFNVEKGQVLSFLVPINNDNYDFYTHPILIPMVYNFSAQQKEKELYYKTDSEGLAFLKGVSVDAENIVSIQGNASNIIPQQYSRGNELKIILPQHLQEGYYHFTVKDSVLGGFSINNSRKESRQDFYSEEELQRANIEVFDAQSITQTIDKKMSNIVPLWYYCLLLAVFFIFLEMFFLFVLKRK